MLDLGVVRFGKYFMTVTHKVSDNGISIITASSKDLASLFHRY